MDAGADAGVEGEVSARVEIKKERVERRRRSAGDINVVSEREAV